MFDFDLAFRMPAFRHCDRVPHAFESPQSIANGAPMQPLKAWTVYGAALGDNAMKCLAVRDPTASIAAYKQSANCYCHTPVRLTRLFAFRRDAPSVTAAWR
jgi:hypothetical protein